MTEPGALSRVIDLAPIPADIVEAGWDAYQRAVSTARGYASPTEAGVEAAMRFVYTAGRQAAGRRHRGAQGTAVTGLTPVDRAPATRDTEMDKPYTDADVELVARTTYEDAEAETPGGWTTPWAKAEKWVRMEYERCARAVLDALAAAGRLASARPTPHLDAVKAERDKLRDANDTLALTLAEAIGALVPDGGGCSRGWIPNSTVDRWRRALHEAEEARRD